MPKKLDMLITQMITFLINVAKDYINKKSKKNFEGMSDLSTDFMQFYQAYDLKKTVIENSYMHVAMIIYIISIN